jgi:phosphatidylglycerol:prolipoprotein diacylglycerol transferase
MDMAAPGVMIGQLMGRWGNFFNGEAHGCVVPESHPLYFMRMGLLPNEDSVTEMFYYHPTFFYESFWNLTGFVIITSLYTKKKFNGQIACMYLSWYGFGRMFIEGLRTDSLYVGSFRISQVVAFLCFIVGTFFLVFLLIRARKAEKLAAVENGEISVYGEMLNEETTEKKEDPKEEENNVGNTD